MASIPPFCPFLLFFLCDTQVEQWDPEVHDEDWFGGPSLDRDGKPLATLKPYSAYMLVYERKVRLRPTSLGGSSGVAMSAARVGRPSAHWCPTWAVNLSLVHGPLCHVPATICTRSVRIQTPLPLQRPASEGPGSLAASSEQEGLAATSMDRVEVQTAGGVPATVPVRVSHRQSRTTSTPWVCTIAMQIGSRPLPSLVPNRRFLTLDHSCWMSSCGS